MSDVYDFETPAPASENIVNIYYVAVDGYRKSWSYTKDGAAAKIRRLLGSNYDLGLGYAVSGDGVGRVTIEGATFEELGF